MEATLRFGVFLFGNCPTRVRLVLTMRPLFRTVLVLVFFLPLAVLGTTAEHTISEADNGREIKVTRGDIIEVRLPAQLGTGYGWRVTSAASRRFELIDGRPKIESSSNVAPGASETEVFRFVARKAGRARLELRYSRPWEPNKKALKTFYLTVVVH